MRGFNPVLMVTLGCLLAASAFAADVQMTIDRQLISLLDRAVLKIEFIETQGDAVDIPEIDGLEFHYQGQSSETRIVNFKSSSKTVHTYVVTPTKVGDYTIGPVLCKFKGGQKEVSTQLRVIKPADDPEAQQLTSIMYSRISTDRDAPFVHEPFGLELKVYLRDGVQIDGNFGIRGGLPESGLDGELQWQVAGRARAEISGAIFNVYTLRSTAKALTAGTFTFQPQVQLNIVIPRQNRRSFGFDDPFFGDLFGRQETRPMVLDCNRLDIAVRPVPLAGRPDSFTGGVGSFDFQVDVGPSRVRVGEPVTVKMRIYGEGNLEKIMPPSIDDGLDFKLYDVRTVPSQNPDEVRFEQVVIPKSDAVTNLPPVTFSYFNTLTADFRTITRGPFPLAVEPGPQLAAQVIATVPSTIPQATQILGHDIVYLKPPPKRWILRGDAAWHERQAYRLLLALPALLLAVGAGLARRRSRLAGDAALARRQQAPRAARRHLQRAEQAVRNGDAAVFYEAAWAALADYFGHRLNLPPGEVSLQAVLARVPDGKEAIASLFETVEQRRYGVRADAGASEMNALLRQLADTLRRCERMKL